jgi:integration host factor subunit beta
LPFFAPQRIFVSSPAGNITSMTRSDLITSLAARFPLLVAKDTEAAVATILNAVSSALIRGERVEVRGFGSFSLNARPARVGRNPKTGEKVAVPAKYIPHFKAGKELRERVQMTVTPPISAAKARQPELEGAL